MNRIRERILRGLAIALLVLTGNGLSFYATASCVITKGGPDAAQVTFTLPPLIVSKDAVVGQILYTEELTSAQITVACDADGNIHQGYTGGLSDADLVTTSSLEGVYATGIPGIGFRAAWANFPNGTLGPENLITPWHMGSDMVKKRDAAYPITLHAAVQLVVTGPVSSGVLDTSKLIADWKYDDKVIGQLRFNSTTIDIKSNTCQLMENNITVPLATITAHDFTNNVSKVVSDDSFKIQLERCDAGIKVDYRFTTSGSTGVQDGDVLSIATGENAAEGIGIQILDSNDTVLQFDQDYTATGNTVQDQSVTIPLKARYIKTGTIKGGQVDAVATFEVYYR
ncbi:fimbrial protein [Citrobacter sp. 50677481]|uniref:fimbrial protein n=1 Tax=Citrobacter sp. 50677481 TaxID=1736699 RepID=UPI00092E641B|nr:fimbrial protein [Citrobacter sp. 50677481]HCQ7754191.1 fimbrial protein [Citrobacter sedlakii]